MRVLVTGASGLLGINLAVETAKQYEVIGVINTQTLSRTPFQLLTAELLAKDAFAEILDKVQPDWVIHCAALANLDECEDDPAFAELMNAILPGEIARVCYNKTRLLHISTDAVFDGSRIGVTEDDEPNPLSVYGRTKLSGEWAVMEANPDAIIARVNLFGWSLKGKRSLAEWFFYNMQAGKAVKGFTDVCFKPMLANHLTQVLLDLLEANQSGIYHVVGANCISKYDFGLAIAQECNLDESLISPVSVIDFGLKAARANNLCLNTNKVEKVLHRSLPEFSTGVKQFFELYQQGYPQILRKMVDNSERSLNPFL